jgi:hypothetical protein
MATKKKVTKKKSTIGSYVKKLQAAPAVKRATKSIKDL